MVVEKSGITSSWLLTFIIILLINFTALAAETSGTKLVVEIATSKAFLWGKPGYSWKDCRPEEESSTYNHDDEKRITLERYNSGGKEVCRARNPKTDLFDSGDTLEILMENGKPIYDDTHKIIFSGNLMPKGFYKVKAKNGKVGWVSEDQVTRPHELEVEEVQTPNKTCNSFCETAKANQRPAKDLNKFKWDFLREVDKQLPFPGSKNEKETDHFACLYRDNRISDEAFKSVFAKTKAAAAEAAKAFKMPYNLILCTMMTESSLYYDPKDKDEYRGLSQVGSAFVEDLQKLMRKQPYQSQWNNYKQSNPGVDFTDNAVRNSGDPRAPAVAVAMGLSWIYNERFKEKDVKCVDCSTDGKFNRKDLYMMITGYNWGPYSLKRVVGRSPASMRNSFPPPKESRDYMSRVENCLAKDHYVNFKEKTYDIEKTNAAREKQIQSLHFAQKKREREMQNPRLSRVQLDSKKTAHASLTLRELKKEAQLQKMINAKASIPYANKIEFCEANYPKQ